MAERDRIELVKFTEGPPTLGNWFVLEKDPLVDTLMAAAAPQSYFFDVWYEHAQVVEELIDKGIIKNHRIAVDVGCHYGEAAYYLARLFKSVACFELDGAVATMAKFNMDKFYLNNIRIFPYGLGEEERNVSVWRDYMGTQKGRVHVEGGTRFSSKIKRMDFMNPIKIDFLKISTNGYESNVIKGAKKSIKKYKPVISVTTPNDYDFRYGSETPDDQLIEMGYIKYEKEVERKADLTSFYYCE